MPWMIIVSMRPPGPSTISCGTNSAIGTLKPLNQPSTTRKATRPKKPPGPRYGGFCAGGIALGNTAPIDPEAFLIVDGKLYLNYSKSGLAEFAENTEEAIRQAEEVWQRLNPGN